MMGTKASLNANHQYRRNVQSQTTHNIHGLFRTSSGTSPYLLASALPWTYSNYMLLIQRVRSDLLSTLPLAWSFLILSGQTSLLVAQSILMPFFQDTTQLPTMTSESNLLEKLRLSLEQWLQAKSSQALASGQYLGTRLLVRHPQLFPIMPGNLLIMLNTSSDYLLQLTSIFMTELFSLTKLSTATMTNCSLQCYLLDSMDSCVLASSLSQTA